MLSVYAPVFIPVNAVPYVLDQSQLLDNFLLLSRVKISNEDCLKG